MLSVMRCRTASVHGHGRHAMTDFPGICRQGVRGNVPDKTVTCSHSHHDLSKLKTNGARDVPTGRIQFRVEGWEGAAEVRSWLPVQVSWLADRRHLGCLPNRAHHLGHLGHLLFESSVGRAALD